MPSTTPKYALPYPIAGDAVSLEPTTVKALADRTDLLLGESGSFSAVMVANTTLNTPITLSRTYPGNSGAAVPGIVILNLTITTAAANAINWWFGTWTGTATTITGFTIGLQANATLTRQVNWRFLPVL